jgi:chemotaxis protein histidine kinase CheA/CheY-like chemotaxis protein
MLTEQTQKIMGYFIEEAKDNLNIIEQGLLNLQQTLEDPELLQELFRAAHSVKGGAAMLGIDSVRDMAHQLEDTFKVLRENTVEVDDKLESLSNAVFDTLQEALEMLSEEEGLTKEEDKYICQKVKPVGAELEEHLKRLINKGGKANKNSQNTAEELNGENLFDLKGEKTMESKGKEKERVSIMGEDSQKANNIDYLDDWFNELESLENTEVKKQDSFLNSEIKTGPAVGIEELNTLADLFEGEAPDLDANWEEEEILNNSNRDLEEKLNWSDAEDYDSGDLTDILFGEDEEEQPNKPKIEGTDLRSLFEETEESGQEKSRWLEVEETKKPKKEDNSSEYLASLFGDFPLEEEELAAPEVKMQPENSSEDLVSLLGEFPELETNQEEEAMTSKTQELEEKEDFKFEDLLAEDEEEELEAKEDGELEDGSLEAQVDTFEDLFGDEITKVDSSGEEFEELQENYFAEEETEKDKTFDEIFGDVEELEEENISLQADNKEGEGESVIDSPCSELEDIWEDEGSKESPEEDFEALENLLDGREESSTEEESEDFEALENLLDGREESSTGEESEDFEALENLLDGREESSTGEESEDFEASFLSEEPEVAKQKPREKSTGGKSLQLDIDFSDLHKLIENMDGDGGRNAIAAAAPTATRRPRPAREQTIKVPARQLDNLSNLMGELVVNRNSLEQGQERMRQFLDNLLHQVMLLGDVGQQMHDLYERTLLEQTIWKSRLGQRNSNVIASNSIASNSNDLHSKNEKSLSEWELDTFTPFHEKAQTIIEQIVRVRESASDIEFLVEEADQVTRQLRQVTNQLQEGLTKARMVPFAQTADRLPRAVWEVSRNCGKEAELVVEGKDTLIDKMIQEQLYDPMTHLVNNAITHGVEMPQERLAAGKPQKGRITIRAFHQGNQTVISVADDGGGIDPQKVKKKAIEKGLIGKSQAEKMSNIDAYDLLFHPGFSTVETANKFAGRGVGMDVVRTKLNEVRGTITIDSTIGKGTVFTIRLPLTLSISRALCCISDRSWIAFPMDGVEDMVKVSSSEVERGPEGQQYIQWRNTKLPFRHLRELLVYNRQMRRANVYGMNTEEDLISVVVLRSAAAGTGLLAIQVDQVLEQQKEIVIKQLEGPVPKPMGIAGATVLGDGKIVAIADTIELMNLASGKVRREDAIWSAAGEDGQSMDLITEEQEEPTVLIVDDSITVRELLSMTFAKSGYRVEQARDGKDAWEKLRSGLPCDLIFCDIEMPRMDGLELLSRVMKDSALSKLPMAMLTSRGASKHKQMAFDLGASGYFTKPYLEDHLLDAAGRMLQGEIVGLTPAAAAAGA